MTLTLLRIGWLKLKRDRVALLMSLVLPIAFFSVFAVIFGGLAGGDGMPKVKLVVADEDGGEESRRIVDAILAEPSFKGPEREDEQAIEVADSAAAKALVEAGDADIGLVLPPGFSEGFGGFSGSTEEIVLYADTIANPIAYQVVQGLLQKIVMTSMPDLLVGSGIEMFAEYAGPLTDEQKASVDSFLPQLGEGDGTDRGEGSDAISAGGGDLANLAPVRLEDVRPKQAELEAKQRMVAFQAAGIGVMFLLFSMVSAAQALLQEETTGTLERVLNTRVSMSQLLAGYWIFAAITGFVQVSLMFLWGWVVFGLDLFSGDHLPGFVIMTAVTAAAAAAFGLALGTLCKSQAQLSGLSTIVVLLMSAVGGSMVPRFLLRQSPLMDKLGLLTFNAWAIDGYQKIFWYETGLLSIWPQVLFLIGLTVVGLVVARMFARRWESV